MLKCGQSVLVKTLSKLFNIILSSGEYPSQWSKGYIHPIHKSGEKDNVVPNSTVKDSKSRILTKFFELKTNERLPKIMDVLSRSTLRQF